MLLAGQVVLASGGQSPEAKSPGLQPAVPRDKPHSPNSQEEPRGSRQEFSLQPPIYRKDEPTGLFIHQLRPNRTAHY